jgi:hypothetical protein
LPFGTVQAQLKVGFFAGRNWTLPPERRLAAGFGRGAKPDAAMNSAHRKPAASRRSGFTIWHGVA